MRPLPRRRRRHPPPPVDSDTLGTILRSLARAHLQGGRAAQPARKIIDEMVANCYPLPPQVINTILLDSLGSSYTNLDTQKTYTNPPNLDATLAIVDALARADARARETTPENSNGNGPQSLGPSPLGPSPLSIDEEFWPPFVSSLIKESSAPSAVATLKQMIVTFSATPSLPLLSSVASALVRDGNHGDVMTVLALAKAAGYELDEVGSSGDGRGILASGLVAAAKNNNVALGLRLLTAAQKAPGLEPDRGDILTILHSPGAQNSALVVHSKAIQTACSVKNWKLAVQLLDLMHVRNLNPNEMTYQNVLNTLCNEKKSRKATQLLFEWADRSKTVRSLSPPSVQTFNTIVNCCEVCGESDLTTTVLDKMKDVHSTDGNTITFNIALKRLAKGGNTAACEGLIMGMLQEGVEPSVVTYTTVIGACAHNRDSELAFEWIRRMKIKGCDPNFHTYNTAFSACLDNTFQGTQRAAALAKMMIADVDEQLTACDIDVTDAAMRDFISLLPDTYTRKLARDLMAQLQQNVADKDVDFDISKSEIEPAFKALIDFNKEEEMEKLGVGGKAMEECVISIDQEGDYAFVKKQREEV